MTNVIGLYDDPGKARQVINELLQTGLRQDDVELMGEDSKQDQNLEQHMAEFGLSQRDARNYAEAVRHGKAVLNAHAPDDQAERVLEILNKYGARDIEEASREYQAEQGEAQSIPEVEEKLEVGKRAVLQGGVRVSTKVTERPVEESVRLKQEKIQVKRQDSDRKLSEEEAKQAFKEETREFTETREVPEVKKEARETGRVEIQKTAKESEEKVKDKVRKTELRTERIEPEGGETEEK